MTFTYSLIYKPTVTSTTCSSSVWQGKYSSRVCPPRPVYMPQHTLVSNPVVATDHKSFIFFFFEEIGPELRSVVNPPLFFFSPRPQYIVAYPSCRSLQFLYVGCRHSMAWWAVCRSVPRIQTSEPQAAEVECMNLNTWPLGWHPQILLYTILLPIAREWRMAWHQVDDVTLVV